MQVVTEQDQIAPPAEFRVRPGDSVKLMTKEEIGAVAPLTWGVMATVMGAPRRQGELEACLRQNGIGELIGRRRRRGSARRLHGDIQQAPVAGETAVIWVALTTVTFVAATLPKLTAVAPDKFVPVIVTDVPPVVGPVLGEIPVTVGAAAGFTVRVALTVEVKLPTSFVEPEPTE